MALLAGMVLCSRPTLKHGASVRVTDKISRKSWLPKRELADGLTDPIEMLMSGRRSKTFRPAQRRRRILPLRFLFGPFSKSILIRQPLLTAKNQNGNDVHTTSPEISNRIKVSGVPLGKLWLTACENLA